MESFAATHQVTVVALVVMLIGILSGLYALTRRRTRWIIVFPILVVILTLVIIFGGPVSSSAASKGIRVQSYGEDFDFAKVYDKNRAFFGEPIAEPSVRQGFFTAYFSGGYLVANPSIPDPYWRMQLENAGLLIMQHRKIPLESNPMVPPVVLNYLASERNQGVDVLKFYGNPRSTPILDSGIWTQYWDKQILSWPANSLVGEEDPSAIIRQPAGTLLWAIEHSNGDPQRLDPWTPTRVLSLAGAGLFLLLFLIVQRLPAFNRQQYEY